MLLIDKVSIRAEAGHGGAGIVSFRRERYLPRGGPDGGDGGRGGDVLLAVDRSVDGFGHFRRKRQFKAESGRPGEGGQRHGRRGQDIRIPVPRGTRVYREGDDTPVAELLEEGEAFMLARGGRGGRGNRQFATAVDRAPRFSEAGEAGEVGSFRLELRLLADVGLVGLPNVGKSTLLAAVSAARPKIGAYSFTTLEPELGVVEIGYERFVLADLPGLVEGAQSGAGLGLEFLQHVQRTQVLLHVVSGESEDPLRDIAQVEEELRNFDARLLERPQIIVISKKDLPQVRERAADLLSLLRGLGKPVFAVSGRTGEGVAELMEYTFNLVKAQRQSEESTSSRAGFQVFRPEPTQVERVVRKKGDKFVLEGAGVPRLVVQQGTSSGEHAAILRERLRRTSWRRILEEAGIQPGDRV